MQHTRERQAAFLQFNSRLVRVDSAKHRRLLFDSMRAPTRKRAVLYQLAIVNPLVSNEEQVLSMQGTEA